MSENVKKPGHPTKYREDFPHLLVETMKKGIPFEQCRSEFNVCKDTMWEWAKVHPAFSEARKIGQAYVERAVIELLWASARGDCEGKPATAIFLAKNILNYRDKTEVEQTTVSTTKVNFNFDSFSDEDLKRFGDFVDKAKV